MLLQLDVNAKSMVLYDPLNEIDTYMIIPLNNDSLIAFNELVYKEMLVPAEFHCSTNEEFFTIQYKVLHVGAILALAGAVGLDKITLSNTDIDD